MKAVYIEFTIAAGKHEGDYINWKYIDQADNCAEALQKFQAVSDYPVCELFIQTTWDSGTITRVPIFGGPEEKLDDEGLWQRTDQAPELEATLTKESMLPLTNDNLIGVLPEYDPLGAQAALDASLVNAYIVRLRRLINLASTAGEDVSLGSDDVFVSKDADTETNFYFKSKTAAEAFRKVFHSQGYNPRMRTLDGLVYWCVVVENYYLEELQLVPNNAMFKRGVK